MRTRLPHLVVLAVWLSAAASAQFWRLSDADEVEIGRQAAEQVEKELKLLDHAEVNGYIERLGRALAEKSTRTNIEYHFKVIDSEEVNAFALPGGFIYVNRGLIEAAENEHELVGVLGHEIGHVAGRHHAADIQRRMLGGLGVGVLGSILGDRGTGAMIGKIAAEVAVSGAFMRYSREAEREADELGARMVHQAGYDPLGMATFFDKLAAMRETSPNVVQRFFSSHPQPEERGVMIAELVRRFGEPGERSASGVEFARIREIVAGLPRPEMKAAAAEGSTAVAPGEAGKITPEEAAAIGPYDLVGDWQGEAHDRQIAGKFAPIFHQGLGPEPRFDYITNFDFDQDWRGDNNWNNAADTRFPLQAWIYYAVRETRTHFFIHYGVFHPRDYKGGSRRGGLLSGLIRAGARAGAEYDPTGLSQDAVLAHENDMEGALLVAEKQGDDPANARLVLVETLAHNKFLKYHPGSRPGRDTVIVEGDRPRLFIEPMGHGIEAWSGDQNQRRASVNGVLTYTYTGNAEVPHPSHREPVGYDLVPLYDTLWKLAAEEGESETYGLKHDYGTITVSVVLDGEAREQPIRLGELGWAFRGSVGGHMARPPWGWFDMTEKDRPLGEWFFQPAETIKRHFNLGDDFSLDYLHTRF